jgi:hypothetical protein
MNLGGLRLKYRTRSIEEWRRLGYDGQALRDRIAENRLHTTDGPDETALLCALALKPYEITDLENKAAPLIAAVRRRLAIQTL